jgi:hypothetical protein
LTTARHARHRIDFPAGMPVVMITASQDGHSNDFGTAKPLRE